MYTFKKEERLCNKKLIDELFRNGSSFLCYPFKISWLPAKDDQTVSAQILFSVAKKRYKRAVDRNLIKRRMRECYRLHKNELLLMPLTGCSKSIIVSVGYIGKEITGYDFMQKKMTKALMQLLEQAIK